MLQKLRRLEERINQGEASKSILEKLRFTQHEGTRTVAMARIHKGVLKLERLMRSSTEIFDYHSHAARRKTPASRMRRLPEGLFKSLASKWPCSCSVRHSARLCLWNCCCTNTNSPGFDDHFNLIVSMPIGQPDTSQWQESTIHVMRK